MKKELLLFAAATVAISSCSSLRRMEKKVNQISYKVTPEVLVEKGGDVAIKVEATMPEKYFGKKVLLSMAPTIKYGENESKYAPMTLQGEKVNGNNEVVPRREGKVITYTGVVPYEEGMRMSDLYMSYEGKKGNTTRRYKSNKITDGVSSLSTLVDVKPMMIAGGNNFERITIESEEASLQYLINSFQVRSSEAEKLKALQEFMKQVKAAEDMNLKNIDVQSYASPDGTLELNDKLANNRDKASVKELKNKMRRGKIEEYKQDEMFKKYIVAEDWEGFKKALESSNIQDKELILRVLSMYDDPEVREKEIKNIASAYARIADEILPKLRRSKMVVNAERIGKSDEEIRTLAKSSISDLNLEETLYAATLFADKGDKIMILKSAESRFPNDWRAINDIAIMLFEDGSYSDAKIYFEKAMRVSPNNKAIQNNLAAIALVNGDVKAAEVALGAATGAGNEVNYNKGIVAIINGEYEQAATYFGNCPSDNATLANLLAGKNGEVSKRLSTAETAKALYLKAVIAARNNNGAEAISNLKAAIAKDASLKNVAATEIEFIKLFDNSDFKAIVK